LIDEITHWNRGINHVTPYWLRLVAFVVVAAPSLVMGRFKEERGYSLRYAAIAYGAFYVLVVALVFYISAAVASDEFAVEAHNIVLRTTVWIGIVVALTGVAAVIESRSSTFLQVLTFEIALLLVLILILVINESSERRD